VARRTKEKRRPDAASMTVVEHLSELRDRIIISLIAVGLGAIVCFALFPQIINLMVGPYQDYAPGAKLIFTNPLEGFLVRIKVASYGGLVLASPVVFFQLWRFITPGLLAKEKRYAIPFVISSVILFAGGGVVAVITLPKALQFLLGIGGHNLQPLLTAGSYLTLVFLMIVAFGVSFEFPIVVVFLLLARVINTGQLRRVRKYTFLGIVIFAAVITPSQDPISLFAMAIPMYLLYEASILIGRLMKR
jgi:sec-independent protein translocase protein TatC